MNIAMKRCDVCGIEARVVPGGYVPGWTLVHTERQTVSPVGVHAQVNDKDFCTTCAEAINKFISEELNGGPA